VLPGEPVRNVEETLKNGAEQYGATKRVEIMKGTLK
jgi:hypothetical protein